LSVNEHQTILGLLRLGWGVRRIARETGHSRQAIRRYQASVDPSIPDSAELAAVPADSGTSDNPPDGNMPSQPPGRSTCEEHRAFITAEHARNRNATAIYQDLVEHHGYTGSDQAVWRFVRTITVADPPYAKCRFETAPAAEAQVDYGEGATTLDERTGKYRKPRLFIMTLGYSRHSYRAVVPASSQETWCRLHEE